VVCGDSQSKAAVNELIQCRDCHTDYHWRCCRPPLSAATAIVVAEDGWQCRRCKGEGDDDDDDEEEDGDENGGENGDDTDDGDDDDDDDDADDISTADEMEAAAENDDAMAEAGEDAGEAAAIRKHGKKERAGDADSCSMCGSSASAKPNLIMYCDDCNLAVHQQCYGVRALPRGDWFCKQCDEKQKLASSRSK
jgi:hypothetical protein